MNTIQAYEKDILSQLDFLDSFVPEKKISKKDVTFCGSGDSLSSAMLAEAFSGLEVRAADPLDLLKNSNLVKKKTVYFISVSGKTISNIRLARIAKKAVAITSKPQSKLAQVSDKTIHLKYPNSDVFTAGSLSFLQSAMTCISLVSQVDIKNHRKIFQTAKDAAKRSQYSNRIFVIGNLTTYPVAMYCAAKFYELTGLDAHYERIEQFSHMELFSAKRGDTVIIFEKKNRHNVMLAKNLRKVGLNVIHPDLDANNKISEFLFYTFYSQLVPLNLVHKKGQKDCNFVISKSLRKASDNMIY